MPLVARAIDEQVLCYFEISEVIRSNHVAQFESTMIEELYSLLGLPHTHTLSHTTRRPME